MWCAKFYEIFNGSMEEDPNSIVEANLSTISLSGRQSELTSNLDPVIQHDSPFSAKSDSLSLSNDRRNFLFNSEFTKNRDYRGEHFSTDTFFSCHQRDGLNFNRSEGPLAIATISHMPLNLPKSMGNTEDKYHREIARSFSLEFSPEQQNRRDSSNFSSPTDDKTFPVRYSPIKLRDHHQSSQDLSGCRISTRSSNCVYGLDPQDSSRRNNEQIVQEIQFNIRKSFENGGDEIVFPMIYRLANDENDFYRVEGGYNDWRNLIHESKFGQDQCRIETENIFAIFSNHFQDQEHRTLIGIDQNSDPVVMSVKREQSGFFTIVRTKNGSKSSKLENLELEYSAMAQISFPNLKIDRFEIFENPQTTEFVQNFDEKLENQRFKFAVIYQRRGQTTEEEFFNNKSHGPALTEFLETISTKISLKNFKGYRGGLDVTEQTDSPISYYEVYQEKEIMFHVSTLLPFTQNDSTQIHRKRHIGNDIVGIVFQEENTPFHPSMIKSNFLHVFLVVQPAKILSQNVYKIMLVARYDIPHFGPALGPNVVYLRNAENLKDFILSKLINAEYAAYRCQTFALLQERTRCSYLKSLCENLSARSYETLCDEFKRVNHRRSYLSSVKKIFVRSKTLPEGNRSSPKSEKSHSRLSKKLSRSRKTIDDDPSSNYDLNSDSRQRTDSLNSSEDQHSSTIQQDSSELGPIYHGDESDEGLDSMSSADNTRLPYDSDEKDAYGRLNREKSHLIRSRELPSFRTFHPSVHHITESTTV